MCQCYGTAEISPGTGKCFIFILLRMLDRLILIILHTQTQLLIDPKLEASGGSFYHLIKSIEGIYALYVDQIGVRR